MAVHYSSLGLVKPYWVWFEYEWFPFLIGELINVYREFEVSLDLYQKSDRQIQAMTSAHF